TGDDDVMRADLVDRGTRSHRQRLRMLVEVAPIAVQGRSGVSLDDVSVGKIADVGRVLSDAGASGDESENGNKQRSDETPSHTVDGTDDRSAHGRWIAALFVDHRIGRSCDLRATSAIDSP